MAIIELKEICKNYGDHVVLDKFTLEINEGDYNNNVYFFIL